MYQMKHALLTQPRADVMGIRNARLADSMDRMHHTKQAHGHVKRPRCIALHTRFDNVVDAAEDSRELLAERVVQVGGTAEGTIHVATAPPGLKAYPLMLAKERAHGEARASALAAYGTRVRQGLEQADALGTGTRHIFTTISRGVDTSLWCVEAHLGSSARQETNACP